MLNVLLFAMVAALFVHTFFNFFVGVYSVVRAKLEAAVKGVEQPTLTALGTVEHFVGGLVAKVVAKVNAYFKGRG